MGLRIIQSVAENHRALATAILVHRALGDWGLEDDRAAVVEERLLWSSMSDSEQEVENAWLESVWARRGAERVLDDVVIPDSAFGLAVDGYRPWAKGPVEDLGIVGKWLWLRGYQVIRWGHDQVTMVIPPHRLVQESERLIAAMVKAGVASWAIGPWTGSWDGALGAIQIRSMYDPVQGVATMELVGVNVLSKALS